MFLQTSFRNLRRRLRSRGMVLFGKECAEQAGRWLIGLCPLFVLGRATLIQIGFFHAFFD